MDRKFNKCLYLCFLVIVLISCRNRDNIGNQSLKLNGIKDAGSIQVQARQNLVISHGAIVRGDTTAKEIALWAILAKEPACRGGTFPPGEFGKGVVKIYMQDSGY